MDYPKLIEEALLARDYAYTPYSHFKVGAALLGKSGALYRGCNVESCSYGPTNCAERTAVFKAVSEGEREFQAIAIVGGQEGRKPLWSIQHFLVVYVARFLQNSVRWIFR